MACEGLAQCRGAGSGVRHAPVQCHPFAHEVAVHRAVAAEDEVDARGFIQEVGIVAVATQLRLQPPDQARKQRVFEGVMVQGMPTGSQLVVLRKHRPPSLRVRAALRARPWRRPGRAAAPASPGRRRPLDRDAPNLPPAYREFWAAAADSIDRRPLRYVSRSPPPAAAITNSAATVAIITLNRRRRCLASPPLTSIASLKITSRNSRLRK